MNSFDLHVNHKWDAWETYLWQPVVLSPLPVCIFFLITVNVCALIGVLPSCNWEKLEPCTIQLETPMKNLKLWSPRRRDIYILVTKGNVICPNHWYVNLSCWPCTWDYYYCILKKWWEREQVFAGGGSWDKQWTRSASSPPEMEHSLDCGLGE